MDKKERILLALQDIHTVTKLIDGIDYHGYMINKLIMVEVELERQLTNLIHNERRGIQSSTPEYAADAKFSTEQQRSEFSDSAGTN